MLTARISPSLVADPRVNGSIAPINRDLRFDPHGPRSRTTCCSTGGGQWPEEDRANAVRPAHPAGIGFASGVVFSSTGQWRDTIGDAAAARVLHGLIDDVQREAPGTEIACADLKRVPAPYPADHPGADLLRHRTMFQLR